jgi:hypothetical protein
MIVSGASGLHLLWMQMLLWEFTHYMLATDVLDSMNINVLGFVKAVISVIAFIAWVWGEGLCLTGCHIHVYTDNSSAHHFYLLLLQVMSLVKIQHGILLTIGHISGRLNIIDNTTSRELDVLNGTQIRESLSSVRRLFLADQTFFFVSKVAKLPFLMPLTTVTTVIEGVFVLIMTFQLIVCMWFLGLRCANFTSPT